MNYKTFKNTYTSEEMYQIIKALDFYSRIWIGQYDQILWELRWIRDCRTLDALGHELKSKLADIRHILLPELDGYGWSGSHGIFSDEIDFRAGAAYDMQQVFRHKLAYFNNPEGGYTVNFNAPIKADLDPYPFPQAECYKKNDKTYIDIEICNEQAEIITDALAISVCLKNGCIDKLFAYYTDNKEALDIASRFTEILKCVPME